jgi:hypothetical protein
MTLTISEDYAHNTLKPEYQNLNGTAESQAGYFTAWQADQIGFTYERFPSNVKIVDNQLRRKPSRPDAGTASRLPPNTVHV